MNNTHTADQVRKVIALAKIIRRYISMAKNFGFLNPQGEFARAIDDFDYTLMGLAEVDADLIPRDESLRV